MLRYKNFTLIKPDTNQAKIMSEIITKNNGSIFHEVALNKIVEGHFKSELFYLVDDPTDITCFCPVHIEKSRLGFKRYNCNPLGDIPYAGFAGKGSIDVKELKVGFKESVKYFGFPYVHDHLHKGTNKGFGETNMVDLALEEDEIFSRMSSSKRRNIRKAIKNGIVIKQFNTIEGFNEFWPILEKLHKALGYHRFTFEYYKSIMQHYCAKEQAYVLIAYKEDVPISGLFIIGNKNYMHFYKGASLFEVKKEGQGELLHWEAIKFSKSLGIKYYDFCNLDKIKLPAIYNFKTGLSKQIISYQKFTHNNIGYKIANRFKF